MNDISSDVYQIQAKYFCAGLVVNNRNIVIAAAPIIKFLIHENLTRVERACKERNWKLVKCEPITTNAVSNHVISQPKTNQQEATLPGM